MAETCRPIHMRLAPYAFLAVAALGGCADSGASSNRTASDPAADESVASAPPLESRWRGTMTVTPATPAAGESVALHFGSERVRGVAFTLSRWTGKDWVVDHYLTSDWGEPGTHELTWWRADDTERRAWPDIGVVGTGPDHVVVPDDAPSGDHLLCTANSVDEACVILRVE